MRAVVVRDGRVLLVRERTDGGWAMPGGWADPGLSPAQIAVKETAEEAGLQVRATRLLALWDRDAQGMEPYAHAVYKAYLAVRAARPRRRAGARPRGARRRLVRARRAAGAVADAQHGRSRSSAWSRSQADPAAPAAFD